MTWVDFGKDGDPARGNADEFSSAVSQWRSAKDRANQIRTQFGQIINGSTLVGLEGQAAQAFAGIVRDTQTVLDDVPQVFGSMETILNNHLTKLRELQTAASQALARAKVAEEERRSSSSQSAAANQRAATLKHQIDQLKALPPEQAGSQLVTLQQRLTTEQTTQKKHASNASSAQSRINAELTNWDHYRSQEDDLNRNTAEKLQHFDLKSLRDPSWLQQQGHNFKKFFGELGSDVWHFLVEASQGNWEQALWHLRGVLDKVLTILAVVGVIVLIIGTVVSLGALAPFLASAVLVLASVKLAVTATLVVTRSVNAETGERLGLVDLAFDAVDVALAAFAFGKLAKSYKPGGQALFKLKGLPQYNGGREFLKEEAGVVFKHGYVVSLKGTTKATGKLFVKKVVEDDQFRDEVGKLGPQGGVWAGPTGLDPRLITVRNDVAKIKSSGRGLNDPIQLVILPTY